MQPFRTMLMSLACALLVAACGGGGGSGSGDGTGSAPEPLPGAGPGTPPDVVTPSDPPPATAPISEVVLFFPSDISLDTLRIGQTFYVGQHAVDTTGHIHLTKVVAWSTTDPTVIEVDASGYVTAVGAGTAVLVAKLDDATTAVSMAVEPDGTPVGGVIATDATWTAADSPFRISSTVQVDFGVTLTIEPGVEVYASRDTWGDGDVIRVGGSLRAIGTAALPISFKNIEIVSQSSPLSGFYHDINLEYVHMNGGRLLPPTGSPAQGSLRLVDSRFIDLEPYTYIWYPIAPVVIERNVFLRSGQLSIGYDHNEAGSITIRNNHFEDWKAYVGAFHHAVYNWVAYNSPTGPLVELNTFASSRGTALRIDGGEARMTATDNWWGTTDIVAIADQIRDKHDDIGIASAIPFEPVLTEPHPDTPVP